MHAGNDEEMSVMESSGQGQSAGWLDVRAAARHLACSPKRIYDLVAEQRVRVARDGRRLLFRVEWLDAMVVEAERRAAGTTVVGTT
jgi:hypothetical protein